MTVKSVLHIILVLWLIEEVAMAAPQEKPCQVICGDTDIPYPFGIGEGCYANENFAVNCDDSTNPPKASLTNGTINNGTGENRLVRVWLTGYVQVDSPVFSYDFSKEESVNATLSGWWTNIPFEYSSIHNRFTAMGCDNYATLFNGTDSSFFDSVVGGCLSICSPNKITGCYGLGCCQASIPPGLKSFQAQMAYLPSKNGGDPHTDRSVFLVDQDWFEQNVRPGVVPNTEFVPVTLQWATSMGSCDVMSTNPSTTYCSKEGFRWTKLMQNVLCVCSPISSDQLKPSHPTGINICDDTSEFTIPASAYSCDLLCISTPEGRNCSCPDGFEKGSSSYCYKITSDYPLLLSKRSRAKIIIIGCGSGLGSLLLIFGTWLLYKITIRRRAVKLKQKFFKKNGGLLLQQQLSAKENNVEQTKVYDSKELDKATDHYHVDRILGQGGQGTVYKGMLTDGRIVAIKKSKVVDEGRLEEFINEVVILSQINHRNVVKLLGCCLETEVPLLVYEFIPNGTLFQHLHDASEEFPITWEMRLRIAIEVAGAVSYLHSAATAPIFHRDIKSTNILLDEKYRARVSDFGTSRSVAVDQTHLTTRVLGTYGYLDPEYFQSSQFTEKSDVYSFGVVLVELLTGQEPISLTRTEHARSLATYFLLAMEEDRLFEIVDARVLKEAKEEEIVAVAKLAGRCLNLNGKKRPNMRAVATELEAIRASNGASSTIQEEYEEIDYSAYHLSGPPVSAFSSSNYCSNSSTSKPIDVEPLLSAT